MEKGIGHYTNETESLQKNGHPDVAGGIGTENRSDFVEKVIGEVKIFSKHQFLSEEAVSMIHRFLRRAGGLKDFFAIFAPVKGGYPTERRFFSGGVGIHCAWVKLPESRIRTKSENQST